MSEAVADPEILLVEDDPHDAELTMRALKTRILASKLAWVRNGVEAMEFILGPQSDAGSPVRCMPALVLLDLKMPKLNGVDVLRRLKSNEATKSIPVVMLTSSREERDIKECYKLGANSYVVKPVNYEAFCEVVTQLRHYWLVLNQPPHR
ncbi:MAG: response regulator [Verrucomicrobia bacterium]|nr:response regulator [Verrucomicrobiota bacterium]